MSAKAKFASLQAKCSVTNEKLVAIGFELEREYGRYYFTFAPKGKRDRLERARVAEAKACDALFAWLDANSPRSWRTGVPASWVCEKLTYDDAITSGQMSEVPPVCYGSTPADSVHFAAALPEKEAMPSW